MNALEKPRTLAWLLAAAFVAGVALRLLWPTVIVYLEDEAWTMTHVLAARAGGGWPMLGMASSRGVANPGMSVWTFIALDIVSGASTPEGLTRAVAVLAIFARALALVVPLRLVREERDQHAWLWAIALTLTNPILVALERKIWAQSLLPFFDIALIVLWMRRERAWGALGWGVLGALVGQIHMAGFFFAPALAIWTKLFSPKPCVWRAWLIGSIVGALPLFPWLLYVVQAHPGANAGDPWLRFRFEFYGYFFSDPTGLGGTYVVGDEIEDALRFPLAFGHATYLELVAHVVLALASFFIGLRGLRIIWAHRRSLRDLVLGDRSDTTLFLGATIGAMGLLMTLPSIPIHRHYMMALFPAPYLWTARTALSTVGGNPRRGARWLAALLVGTCVVSFGFLSFMDRRSDDADFTGTRKAQIRLGRTIDRPTQP